MNLVARMEAAREKVENRWRGVTKGFPEEGHWGEIRYPKGDGPATITHHAPPTEEFPEGHTMGPTPYKDGFVLIRWWKEDEPHTHEHCSCVLNILEKKQ